MGWHLAARCCADDHDASRENTAPEGGNALHRDIVGDVRELLAEERGGVDGGDDLAPRDQTVPATREDLPGADVAQHGEHRAATGDAAAERERAAPTPPAEVFEDSHRSGAADV